MKFLLVICAIVACGLAASLENSKRCISERSGVSADEITAIIDQHNYMRSNPNISQTAEAMCKVYWDPNIAKIAQSFADTCPNKSSRIDKMRNVPGYGFDIGQNLGWGHTSWKAGIQEWFDEVEDFVWGNRNGQHYSQIVKDTTCRIGCGYANCDGVETYVCNYATRNNYRGTPFETGTPCDACPNSCSNEKLCDTKGKMCYNGGTMDYSTNTCSCHSLYSGEFCEIVVCRGWDGTHCGNSPKSREQPSDCKTSSFTTRICPVMCGVCKLDGTPGENYIQIPAANLVAGTGGSAAVIPAGSSMAAPGIYDPTKACLVPKDEVRCWYVNDEMCKQGDRRFNLNGKLGTPNASCPIKCGFCKNKKSN